MNGENINPSVMSYSLQPHGLYISIRLLCPWDFPGKNTGVSKPFPSPGNLPDPEIEPGPSASQAVFTILATKEANVCVTLSHILLARSSHVTTPSCEGS